MTGSHLVADLLRGIADAPPIAVSGLALDSRCVRPGDLFCAVRGGTNHGLDHRAQALSRGAVAVAYEPAAPFGAIAKVPHIEVPNLQGQLGIIASRFFGEPASRLNVIGVTGTNGKSSVTWFVAQALGEDAAVMGTLGWGRCDALRESRLTTPDAITLQRRLRDLVDAGVKHVAMEVSSHAIAQHRIGGCRLVGAAVTNVSHDHLDYHSSMDEYAAVKARLFAAQGLRFAIVNGDDGYMRLFKETILPGVAGVEVSSRRPADIYANNVQLDSSGLRFELCTKDLSIPIRTSLFGRFNVDNLLTSAAILMGLGWTIDDVALALPKMQPPRGRMTRLDGHGKPTVVVDYAHTPDALDCALRALREHGYRALTVVFGCGGDRDRSKRPVMGAAAAKWTDQIILTDDNPRHEDGDAIISDILPGVEGHPDVSVARNREAAIEKAISATPGDGVVLIAGKGHETYQDVMGARRHCDDIETASRMLEDAA